GSLSGLAKPSARLSCFDPGRPALAVLAPRLVVALAGSAGGVWSRPRSLALLQSAHRPQVAGRGDLADEGEHCRPGSRAEIEDMGSWPGDLLKRPRWMNRWHPLGQLFL